MAPTVKQASNSATGFSNNFMTMLSGLLGGVGGHSAAGQFGQANPTGQTQGGAAGILSDILSGGAGKLGGALGTQLQQQQTRDINSINSRFGAFGGTSLGTPAASADAQYRAQAAPNITSAIGQLQLGAISPLLSAGYGLANRGVTTPYMQTNPIVQGIQGLTGAVSGAGSILSGLGMGGGGSANTSSMVPPNLGSLSGYMPSGSTSNIYGGMDPGTYYAMMGSSSAGGVH